MIVRHAVPQDAPAMAEILNAIILAGGTTAHEHEMSEEVVRLHYIDGPEVETSVLAVEADQVIGWQSLGMWNGEIHIGTFVRIGTQAKGVGASMFAATCAAAKARGLTQIIAHIRADNVPGLAYYARMGFRDIGGDPDFALEDGRVVGRVFRRFDLV
jgi:L-amino acid N-acyltransferase YncA